MDKISVVVLTHNRIDHTRWCLEGLRETSYRPLEIVFVDNGSTDGTVEALKKFSSSFTDATCRVVENAANVGCSTARNQGVDSAEGTFVCFIDNDVVVRTRGWLEGLSEPFADRQVGATSPKLVFPFPPYPLQCAGAAVSPAGKVEFMGRGDPRDAPEHNVGKDLQCTISACMLMRRDVFLDIGGFDEAFNPVQYEDIDLCYRLRHSDFRIRHVPEIEMYHFENTTTGGPDVRGKYHMIKNGMLFKKRWHFMFSKEGGPDDSDIRWVDVEAYNLSDIKDLEFL